MKPTYEELEMECFRLTVEIDRLRAENLDLRPRVSDLTHRNAVLTNKCRKCDYLPTTEKIEK